MYGEPYKIRINGFDVPQYDKMHEKKVFKDVKKYVVSITRAEGGHTHEATDKLHRVGLSKKQIEFIESIKRDLYVETKSGLFMGDTPATLGQKLHQVSGGFVKGEDDALLEFKKKPKVKFIKSNFDPEETIILAHFKAEQEYLRRIFPHVGSTTRNSEGVDYSHFKHMVIYSHSHAASTYQQVRQRQANISRKWPIVVNFLIGSDADQHVYDIASGKIKFTKRWYE